MKRQILKKSKEETDRLAEENRTMEMRLQELKLAMNNEKKSRIGGHWQSAARDTQTDHDRDALKKNLRQVEKPKVPRQRKVKVLKDEPLILPPQPPSATKDIKRIMRKELPKELKETGLKTKRCGQCETKAAAVLCQDCGENYCPSCFASFHLKGALRKHRSVPIQALGVRQSPRLPFMPKPPPVSYHEGELNKENTLTNEKIMEELESPKMITESPKKNFVGPSLLDGEYDEGANAREFQAALAEWRSAGRGDGKTQLETKTTVPPKSNRRKSPRDSFEQSKVIGTPRLSIDVKGTSTEDTAMKPVKIEFHSNISYSDKLLLRKHRREPVDVMSVRASSSDFLSPRFETEIYHQAEKYKPDQNEGRETVSFEALYEVTRSTPRPHLQQDFSSNALPGQRACVIEMVDASSDISTSNLEQVTSYQVEEDPGCIEFVNNNNVKNTAMSKSTTGKDTPTRSKTPSNKKTNTVPPVNENKKKNSDTTPSGQSTKLVRESSDTTKTSHKSSFDKNATVTNKPPTNIKSSQKVNTNTNPKSDIEVENSPEIKLNHSTKRPNSRSQATPRSARQKSRASTPRSARPNSRQSSRPFSRLSLGEGILTKKPTSALSSIANRPASDKNSYQELGEILTLGVQAPHVDKVIIPRSHTPKSARTEKKQTVSYKLYAMGPKSWRPDSSMGEVVLDAQVNTFNYDLDSLNADIVEDDVKNELQALNLIGNLGLQFKEGGSSANSDLSFNIEKSVTKQQSTPEYSDNATIEYRLDQSSRLVQSTSSIQDDVIQYYENESESGRTNNIVVDGDDMTLYDDKMNLGPSRIYDQQGNDDCSALDQLEWELASLSGRITADGKISRLSLHSSQDSAVSSPGSSQNLETEREIDSEMRNEGTGYDEFVGQINDELEVRALK